MSYVVSHFWMWLLAALLAGVLTAILVREPEEQGKIAVWLRWAGLAFAAGAVAAVLGVFAGRAGLYLETALATFAAFLAGGAIATAFNGGSLREHKGWALGLVPAALIWWAANLFAGPGLEADLKRTITAEIQRAGGDPPAVDVSGRDVLLQNGVADRPALAARLLDMPGVRRVAGIDKMAGAGTAAAEKPDADQSHAARGAKDEKNEPAAEPKPASPAIVWAPPADTARAGRQAAPESVSRPTPETPANAAPRALTPAAAGAPAGVTPAGGRPAGSTPATAAAAKTKSATAVRTTLPVPGMLDAAHCQAALSAIVAIEKIQFRSGSASIHRASANVLDKLAAIFNRCANVKVEIGGHTDNVGGDEDNDALSQRRADAVVAYLRREGVGHHRLTGAGYGARKPIASNDTDEGRAENRRIEFVVK